MGESVMCPFTVLYSQNDHMPYRFRGLTADVRAYGHSWVKGGEDLVVMSRAMSRQDELLVLGRQTELATYIYAVEGHPNAAVMRIMLDGWYLSCGTGRPDFEKALEGFAEREYPAVVIEATLEDVASKPPPLSKLNPKTAYRSLITWSLRYRLPIIPAGPRELAEVTTFRLLERGWKELTG